MQDFKLEQDLYSLFDIVIDEESKVIDFVDGMETAIEVQLFTDQRVSKEERANPEDRRGWIGDIITRDIGYSIGSLIHLQEQSRDTLLDNNETAAYAKSALDYFVDIGATKEITAQVVGKNIQGVIKNSANSINRFSKLWRSTIGT